jgi:hypothetical protein
MGNNMKEVNSEVAQETVQCRRSVLAVLNVRTSCEQVA